MSWRRIAEILAREATFRAQREMSMSRGKSKLDIITSKNALRYNFFVISLLSLISILVGLASFEGKEAAVSVMLPLFLIEMMVGTLSVALTVQVIISDDLVKPIQYLPVSESELRKALTLLDIYWGGVALPFTMIPAGLVSTIILRDLSLAMGFTLASIVAMLLSIALGYLAGSIGGRYTRSLLRRTFSTVIWVILLGIGFLMSPLMEAVSGILQPTKGSLGVLTFIPPFSFVFILENLFSLASSAIFFLLSLGLLRYGIGRFWRIATSPEVIASVKPPSWKLSFGIKSVIMRDLKIASRNPRMMASLVVYSLAFPIVLIGPVLSGSRSISEPGFLRSVFPIVSMSIGGLQASYSPYYFYIIEAAGARALYTLPLTRSKLASMKLFSMLIFNSIPISIVSVGLIYFLGSEIGLTSVASYLLTLFGSAYLNCLAYARMLPRSPASWSVETFGRGLIGLFMIVQTAIYIALLTISLTLPSRVEVFVIAVVYLATVYASSLYLAWSMRKESI